jgi:hypothetical protein
MKKAAGRPAIHKGDQMVPLSASIPRSVRDLIEQLAAGGNKSAIVCDLLDKGIKNPTIKKRLGR